MRGAALALALLACAVPVAAQNRGRGEVRDVPWYQARPAVLEETLRRCHRDARLAASYDCQNAEGAAASRLGRPPPRAPGRAPGIAADGLPEPDYNPRTNPLGYQALKRACTERGPGSEMFLRDCHRLGPGEGGGIGGR